METPVTNTKANHTSTRHHFTHKSKYIVLVIKKREVGKALQIPLCLSTHHKQFKAVSTRALVSPSSSAHPCQSRCLLAAELSPACWCQRCSCRTWWASGRACSAGPWRWTCSYRPPQWNTILPIHPCQTHRGCCELWNSPSHPVTKSVPQVRHGNKISSQKWWLVCGFNLQQQNPLGQTTFLRPSLQIC